MRFLHTADLQIGMTASGVGKLAKELQDARVESLQAVLHIAAEKQVNFVVIAGDLFETNQVSPRYRQQVAGTLEGAKPLRVFILPGNHDYLGPNSVYQSEEFARLGPHITVFRERTPFVVPDLDLTFYPGPCFETRSHESPARWIKKQIGTRYHVAVLHGSMPTVIGRTSDEDEYFPMLTDELKALDMDYIALGHWHSLYPDPATAGDSPFYYSGTPEPTGFGERKSGHALLVEMDETVRRVTALPTAQFRFLDLEKEIKTGSDVEPLRKELLDIPSPHKTLVRIKLGGIISISTREALDNLKVEIENRLAHIRFDDQSLLLEPDEADLGELTKGGVAATTFAMLKKQRDQAPGPDREKYGRAIALAYKAFKGTLD